MKKLGFAAVLFALAALDAHAATITVSTFDTDTNGWTVGEFFSSAGSAAPTLVPSGGNPGGFIRTIDVFGFNAYQAPSAFLGDQSAAYGGTLSLDMQVLSNDDINYPMVVIGDGATTLQFRTTPPGTTWTSYAVPLLASGGWEIADGTGSPRTGTAVSEAQLLAVLTNLAFLKLDADWLTGPDQVDLDNVALCTSSGCDVNPPTAVPEPASLTLLGLGLAGMGARRCRQRQG